MATLQELHADYILAYSAAQPGDPGQLWGAVRKANAYITRLESELRRAEAKEANIR